MIDRPATRRRLASATYHNDDVAYTNKTTQAATVHEVIAEQIVAVFAESITPEQDDVARRIAGKQVSGLPFFVMSVPRVLDSMSLWRSCLPRVRPFYSLRCNADPVFTRLLSEFPEMGFEVSDPALLEMALDMVSPEKIVYSNPCLTRKVIRHANDSRVATVTVESEVELMNVMSYAPDAEILLRVCVAPHLPYVSHNVDNQFGCSLEEAADLLLVASEMRARVVGLGFHVGSGCLEPSVYYKAIHAAKELFVLGTSYGLTLDTLSLGGGFNGVDKADFVEVSDVICSALDTLFPPSLFPSLRVMATPGRFFAAPAFSLCTSVIAKRATDAKFITNDEFDSGVGFVYQTNDGVYGSFGCRMADNCHPRCRPLTDGGEERVMHHATVLGPHLDGTDVAQPRAILPSLSVGEWLLWENMGAYSIPHPVEQEETPQLPVYYYDCKNTWDARQLTLQKSSMSTSSSFATSPFSSSSSDNDNGSEAGSFGSESDVDSVTYEDDLADCLQRVFFDFDY